jgi:hypothetical protein
VGRDFVREKVMGLGVGVILIDFASVEEMLAGRSQLLMGFTKFGGGLKGRDGVVCCGGNKEEHFLLLQ